MVRRKLWKIILAFLTASCVIVSFVMFIRNTSEQATSISIESLKDATNQSAQRINESMSRAAQEIQLTAYLYEEMMHEKDVSFDDLSTLVEESPFDYIEYADANGNNRNNEKALSNIADRAYFQDAMAGNSGIDVVFHTQEEEENQVVFYTPLHYEGEIIGVLCGIYTESQVERILANSFFGEDSRTFLCTSDGTVIASGLGNYTAESIYEKDAFHAPLRQSVEAELRTAISTSQSYAFQYEGTSGTGNGYVAALDGCDWMLIQTFPSQVTSQFITDANDAGVLLLVQLILIFVVCLIVILVGSYIQKKRLLQENTEKSYVIDGITNLFGMFVLVDLQNHTYRYLENTKPRFDKIPVKGSYDCFLEYLVSLASEQEAQTYLASHMTEDGLIQNLSDNATIFRYEYRCAFDTEKWDSLNVICLKREHDVPTEILVTCRDVTSIKSREQKSYEALREAYQAVESANHAKSSFLSNMSHDIRTPMNAIMGMTAIAAMNIENTDRVKDCLNKISMSSQHLLGLINEVLDMSKIESGKLVFNEEEFNLPDVIERVIAMFLPQTDAKHQIFKVNVADIVHEEVIGDSMRLQQIFINILGNAVKFTPDGGKIRFDIREKSSSMHGYGCYVFVFEDSGIGMDEAFVARIFEPFSRANDSYSNKIEGTGLGMSIVKNIVQMMNGEIQVESKLHVGSTFTVTIYLRLNRTNHDDVQVLQDLPVLVADDDQFACESACSVLKEIGMKANWVLSGEEAVEVLVEAHDTCKDYAAVILDWKMPGKDGIETAKEIRAKVGTEVPIIILSAFDYSAVEQEARDAGVDAFISKPLFRSRLICVMKSLLLGEEKRVPEVNALRSKDFSGKRVLLVEDNDMNMEIAEELLSQTGISVDTAINGKLAVQRVLDMPPNYYDLVFMDIQMPEMNGYDATTAIRASAREDLKQLPIVAMSADVFMDDIKHARDVGMNGHVAKPVEIDNLIRALEEWIS